MPNASCRTDGMFDALAGGPQLASVIGSVARWPNTIVCSSVPSRCNTVESMGAKPETNAKTPASATSRSCDYPISQGSPILDLKTQVKSTIGDIWPLLLEAYQRMRMFPAAS